MTNTEQAILATKNGSVALYHDGGNKIETLSIATVTGIICYLIQWYWF